MIGVVEDYDFGEGIDPIPMIVDVADKFHNKDAYTQQVVLNERYLETYALTPTIPDRLRRMGHERKSHHMLTIMQNPKGYIAAVGPVAARLRQYIRYGIKDLLGMDYLSFRALETADIEMMLESAQLQREIDAVAMEQAKKRSSEGV